MRWSTVGRTVAAFTLAALCGCGDPDGRDGGADSVALPAPSGPATSAATATVTTTSPALASPALPTGTEPASSAPETSMVAEPAVTQPPETTEPQPWRARLVFTGDILSHEPVSRQARADGSDGLTYDYLPMFDEVRAVLSGADLAICHLETPLSPDNEDLSGYPLFNVPGDLAVALAEAGYDGCSTASNHSLDRGVDGIAATLGVLERAGLGHAGMARTVDEAAVPTLYDVEGVTVGHLSYTYGLNELRLPPDQQWAVDVIDPDAIEAEARAAVDAGARFVVLSLQWGVEFVGRPIARQRTLAERLLASEHIDLIVGSHAHVLGPIGRVGDKYVIYGLGNFLTNQSPLSCRSCPESTTDGVIVGVDLAEASDGRIEVVGVNAIPTWVDRRSFTITDIAAVLAGDLGPNTRRHFERSWKRTASALRALDVDIAIKGDPAAGPEDVESGSSSSP